ncbi:MAG TPA: hypothetical protein PLB32_10460, partial [Acidobacteriota bacterium]|nr:hypothetical protein [Acidobacteriota bacterium]
EEGFTIAGAKKRLASEMRASSKLKVVPMERPVEPVAEIVAPAVVEPEPDVVGVLVASLETGPLSPLEITAPESTIQTISEPLGLPPEAKAALRRVRTELEALLTILR